MYQPICKNASNVGTITLGQGKFINLIRHFENLYFMNFKNKEEE